MNIRAWRRVCKPARAGIPPDVIAEVFVPIEKRASGPGVT